MAEFKEVSDLLNYWKLPQLCDVFREHEICLLALGALTDGDIAELIPKIGPRAIFRSRLNEWRRNKCANDDDSINENALQIEIKEGQYDEVCIKNEAEKQNGHTDAEYPLPRTESPNSLSPYNSVKFSPGNNTPANQEISSQEVYSANNDTAGLLSKSEMTPYTYKKLKKAAKAKKIDVMSILQGSYEGLYLLENYKNVPEFARRDQVLLSNLICKHVIENNVVLNVYSIFDIASQIAKIFPSEKAETYYSRFKDGGKNSGILFNKYYNMKRLQKSEVKGTALPNPMVKRCRRPSSEKSSYKEQNNFILPEDLYNMYGENKYPPELDLEKSLKGSNEGCNILDFYKQRGKLDARTRHQLCSIISMEIITKGLKLERRIAHGIVCQLLKLFPGEKYETYLLPCIRGAPKGILYNRYLITSRRIKREHND